MVPGQHLVMISRGILSPPDGLEHRDTLKILMPGPGVLLAFLFRVPLAEPTVCQQVLVTGTGGLWIDGCRVRTTDNLNGGAYAESGGRQDLPGANRSVASAGMLAGGKTVGVGFQQPAGRWPSNLLLVHHPECANEGTKQVRSHNPDNKSTVRKSVNAYGEFASRPTTGHAVDGLEVVASWRCHPQCPVPWLDRQSGVLKSGDPTGSVRNQGGGMLQGQGNGVPLSGYGDSGGASRYYPQFASLGLAIDWVQRLIQGPGEV